MLTVEIQRHIVAKVQVATNAAHRQDMTIEVRGSTVYFRSRGVMTEVNSLEAKKNPGRINNAVRALISDIYDYEADYVVSFVLELI